MKTKIIIGIGIIILIIASIYFYKQNIFQTENVYVAPSVGEQVNTNQNGSRTSIPGSVIKQDIYTISYTDKGFVPKQLQIPKGKSVKFVNNSNKSMRIFADDNVDPRFTDINQPKSVGKGGVYTFNFIYAGVWAFHNQSNTKDGGNVVVY